MARPRFLLVARSMATRRSWLWWLDTAGPAGAGGDRPAEGDGSWTAWRLAGGNNRELGRSARTYQDVASCVASVDVLRQGVDRAEPAVGLHEITGLWWWRLDLDGRAVAGAARLYPRRREAVYSLTQFTAAAAQATLAPDVMHLDRPDRAHPGPVHRDRPEDHRRYAVADRLPAPHGTARLLRPAP